MKNAKVALFLLFLWIAGGILWNPEVSAQEQFSAVLARGDLKTTEQLADHGEAFFEIGDKGKTLHYVLRVKKISDITMVHLHLGTTDQIGTPVVWLYPDAPPPKKINDSFTGVLAEGKITADDLIGSLQGKPLQTLVQKMRAGMTYVNVHTAKHPESAIYGRVQ